MKRLEVTVPKKHSDEVREVLEEYTTEVVSDKVEKNDQAFIQFHVTLDSDVIDEVTEELKGLKDLETGDLTIDILEQKALIEKGKRQEGGSSSLSVQEMYAKAFEFAAFNKSSWALIALAAGIAVFGVVMENVMVVIGAMVIAPMLGPFLSLSFGIIVGDRRLIQDSILYGVLSMLFAVAVAFLIGLLLSFLLPIRTTSLMTLIADPGFATVPLSLLVGAAAALTFTTEMRESLAGVAVAIALVPPAAVVGISLAMLNMSLFFDVSLVLLTNVTALILAGSITFKMQGITPATYYRKKVSEEELRKMLVLSIAAIIVLGSIVGYISFTDLKNESVRTEADAAIAELVGENIISKQVDVSRNRVTISLAVVNPAVSADRLKAEVEERTGRQTNVTLIAVEGEVQ